MATYPTLAVEAEFAAGTWTDITAYVRSGTITRPGSRQTGPAWTYQAGTCSLVLNNTDGRFDPDNLAGPYVTASGTRTVHYQAGSGTFTVPHGASGTMQVECWAAGGGGHVNVGGGGGEYAAEPALAVSAGQQFAWSVGAPGTGGTTTGTAGGDTTFGPVTAHGGGGTGSGGTGSTNTVQYDGGNGAPGAAAPGGGASGGGGGGSGGTGSAGNSATLGGGGAAAVTGGGPGGSGGEIGYDGNIPVSGPGGGGGGGGAAVATATVGGNGAGGQIAVTYTISGSYTQVLPMVPIRVRATWNATTYDLFSGYADGWSDDGANYNNNYDQVTVTATDAFKVLSGVTLATAASQGGGEDTGSRISRILDAAAWSSSARSITTGDSLLQATTFGADALSLAQLAADSELGELYVDGSGNVVFRHRHGLLTDTRSASPQAVFGDIPGTVQAAGTELAYARAPRADDDIALASDCQITRAGGGLQEATDLDAIARFRYPRTYARSDLLMETDAEALAYAQWIVYTGGGDGPRFDSLTILPRRDPAGLFPQALGRELGDRIQIWRRPPGVASAVTKDCFIRGIAHTFDASAQAWQTDFTLQSAARYGSFFVLDDTTLGRLDFNALAY